MMDWNLLGGWVTFALVIVALIFSALCYRMIVAILRHVLKFDPESHRRIYEDRRNEDEED